LKRFEGVILNLFQDLTHGQIEMLNQVQHDNPKYALRFAHGDDQEENQSCRG